jgi:GNAT superfamily N-acetyltransferase
MLGEPPGRRVLLEDPQLQAVRAVENYVLKQRGADAAVVDIGVDVEVIQVVLAQCREADDAVRELRDPRLGPVHQDVGDPRADLRVGGFAALGDDHLDHLYVHPDFHHGGVGTALLQHVIFHRPNGLKLWVFQQNAQARRFYEHHGFVLLHQTDGAANEERTPDALYGWTPSHALRGSA